MIEGLQPCDWLTLPPIKVDKCVVMGMKTRFYVMINPLHYTKVLEYGPKPCTRTHGNFQLIDHHHSSHSVVLVLATHSVEWPLEEGADNSLSIQAV